MPYFDFQNTPITSDITLKARWCCQEPEPTNPYPSGSPEANLWDTFYHGKGARLTMADGTVYYMPKANYGQLVNQDPSHWMSSSQKIEVYSTPDFTGAVTRIPMLSTSDSGPNKIEFGSDGTDNFQPHTFEKMSYEDFTITGVLTKIPKNFIGGIGGWDTEHAKCSIIFSPVGSAADNDLRGFICSYCGISGTVVFDCTNDFFSNVTKSAASETTMLSNGYYDTQYGDTYRVGFKVGGKAADYVLANFPNQTNYRKLSKLT